jgi:hypothetical protein
MSIVPKNPLLGLPDDIEDIYAPHTEAVNEPTRLTPPVMTVRNLNSTSNNGCRCGSWLEHWARHGGKSAFFCSTYGCPNIATVGGHVQKDDAHDRAWYVVPLCASCSSKQGGELAIWPDTTLVPANIQEACGR